jgi:hypothetical protein
VSLLDAIYNFETGVYTITRRATGTHVNGVYVPNPTTTNILIRAVIQPAVEIQRVTAGRDMREREQNQQVDDVQIIHTDTEIFTRTPTNDPDVITFDGDTWIIIRVEKWVFQSTTFWKGVMTRETQGAS